jgi:hypothetical protein
MAPHAAWRPNLSASALFLEQLLDLLNPSGLIYYAYTL